MMKIKKANKYIGCRFPSIPSNVWGICEIKYALRFKINPWSQFNEESDWNSVQNMENKFYPFKIKNRIGRISYILHQFTWFGISVSFQQKFDRLNNVYSNSRSSIPIYCY